MAAIPESHWDLLERPIVVTLVTMMPDGSPQATPIWFSYDGTHIWVNTARGRRKDQNLRARPQVAVMILDPDDPYRYLAIRGTVQEINEADALEHINQLSERYRGYRDYYRNMPQLRGKEQRVIFKIRPDHVVAR